MIGQALIKRGIPSGAACPKVTIVLSRVLLLAQAEPPERTFPMSIISHSYTHNNKPFTLLMQLSTVESCAAHSCRKDLACSSCYLYRESYCSRTSSGPDKTSASGHTAQSRKTQSEQEEEGIPRGKSLVTYPVIFRDPCRGSPIVTRRRSLEEPDSPLAFTA